MQRESFQSAESMGNVYLWLWICANPKLSQTPRNKNKVFLGCPKNLESRCNYFQWIHEAPKPVYMPKTATRSALKKRLNDMVPERILKKQKTEGGFQFP